MSEVRGSTARVVVGVDCTPAAQELLRWADRQAQVMGGTLVAVTAWRTGDNRLDDAVSIDDTIAQMRYLLDKTIDSALPPDRANAVQRHVSVLVPAEALIELSDTADLIVVGPRSAGVIVWGFKTSSHRLGLCREVVFVDEAAEDRMTGNS